MPKRRVLDVGNCSPDHRSIRRLLQVNFDADVVQAHGRADTLELVRREHYDLVLVNRKLDRDSSDGIEIIEAIKTDQSLKDIPVMLITNFAKYQDEAVAFGAMPGFGKLDFDAPETIDKLKSVLG